MTMPNINSESLSKMNNMIRFLNKATIEYNKGHPIISDSDWDKVYFELAEMERQLDFAFDYSPTQKIHWEAISDLKKVKHSHKMLSLQKTKSVLELEDFLSQDIDEAYVIMAKMDGLTCSLTYENGELVLAETRGNGEEGEDITHNIKAVRNIPMTIPYLGRLVIDGEIICEIDVFNKKFSKDYKNARNFASGSIRLLDPKQCSERCLSFVAWEVIEGGTSALLSYSLAAIEDMGFTCVPLITANEVRNADFLLEKIDTIKDYCERLSYPIDGCVIKFDNEIFREHLGETAHHPKGAIAYKFEDEQFETELLDITYDVSRRGVLTPVAIFKPVDIEGTLVSRANLSNLSIMVDTLGEYPEYLQPIWVSKRNLIIPKIERAVKNCIPHDHIIANSIPNFCPICGGETKIIISEGAKTLVCANEACPRKIINVLDHFFGKKGLDIKGLSKATFEKLIEWNWVNTPYDVFELNKHKQEWKNRTGFGEKSVNNILAAIEKGREQPLESVLSAAGIPLIGQTAAKEIAKRFSTYEAFREATKNYNFNEIAGFGENMNDELHSFDYSELDKLIKDKITIVVPKQDKEVVASLSGLTFVITGKLINFKNRDALKKEIELHGGKVASSVSKNTSYLINNDLESTSAKNQLAKRLGIPIISESSLMAIIGQKQ